MFARVYGDFRWIGMITEIDMNKQDVLIEFLHPHGPRKNFHWPTKQDKCLVPIQWILACIETPATTTGRMYEISEKDHANIIFSYDCFVNKV